MQSVISRGAIDLSCGNSALSDARSRGGTRAGHAVAGVRRRKRRAPALDQSFAPRRKDFYGLPQVWPADLRFDFGGQCWAYPSHEALRSRQGIRFSTYAVWWIKASILDYIMRSWSLVKIGTTVNQKKLLFNLSKAKRRISALQQGDLDPEKVTLIANELGVAERDVVEMNQRISRDVSLNVPMNQEGDSAEWQDTLVEEGASQETDSRRNRGVGNPQKGA